MIEQKRARETMVLKMQQMGRMEVVAKTGEWILPPDTRDRMPGIP